MWRRWRLMAPAGADGGGAGGQGSGTGAGAGTGQGAGTGTGEGKPAGGGTILSGGAPGAGAGQGNGQGAAGAGAGAGAGSTAWNWAEGVVGTGERPAWFKGDKYKSVSEQAAALPGLEAKLGAAAAFFGAPEGGRYAAPTIAAELKDKFQLDPESGLFKAFSDFAAKKGLSQAGFDELANLYAGVVVAEGEAEEASLADALGKLGANVAQRIDAVRTYVTAQVGAEGFAALDAALGTNVAAFQAFEKLIAQQANDPRLAAAGGSTGLGFSRADIEKAQFEVYADGPLKGQRKYDHDAAHRTKVDDMWRKLFPGEGHQFMGGA